MSVFEGDPLLLKTLMFLLLAVVLPFAGIMAAGGGVALCCDLYGRRNGSEGHRRLAAALLERVAPGRGVWFLLPLGLALALLCQWLVYGLAHVLTSFWGAALLFLLTGGGALRLSRNFLSRNFPPVLAFGGAGVLLIAAALYLLILGEALIQRPDQLPLLPRLPEVLISWHGTWRFFSFAALSLAATGALLRWGGAHWTGENEPGRRGGAFLLGAGLLSLPLLIVLELLRAAPFALSPAIFILAVVAIVQTATVFLLLATGNKRRGFAFGLTILIFPVWILMGHLGREEAQADAIVAGTAVLLDFPVIGVPTALVAAPPVAPAVDGEAVFNRHCVACHQFDRRVVGPPLDEVLPKYVGDEEGLIDFIRDPVRVNPDYPPMPQLNLSEAEREAVASWLLQRIEE
jgi:cytochrome c551/c552